MTVGEITFDLGLGSSPFLVTIGDASGLAPLDLPEAFTMRLPSHDEPPLPKPAAEPSAGAVRRFETAMSNDASFGTADHPLRVFRNMATATSSADAVVVEKPKPGMESVVIDPSVVVQTQVAVETPVATDKPVVAEKPIAVGTSVVSGKPIAVESPVVAESTTEAVEKTSVHSVGTAPRAVRDGRGATALPVFATAFTAVEKPRPVTASVVIDPSVVVQTPFAIEKPVAIDKPVVAEKSIAGESPVVAESTTEAVEKTSVHSAGTVPRAVRGGRGATALPVFATAFTAVEKTRPVTASVVIDPSVVVQTPVAVETPVAIDKPVVAETPVVAEKPIAVETPVVAEKPIAVETPVVVEKSIAVETPVVSEKPIAVESPVAAEATTETVEKSSVHSVVTAPRAVRGGRGATALPVFTTSFTVAENLRPVTASVVIDPSVVTQTPVAIEAPVTVEQPVVAPGVIPTDEPVVAEKPIAVETPEVAEKSIAVETTVVAEKPMVAATYTPDTTSVVIEAPAATIQAKPVVIASSDDVSDAFDASKIAVTPVLKSTVTPDIISTDDSIVTEKSVVAEKPIAAEGPIVAETTVAAEEPISAEITVAAEEPIAAWLPKNRSPSNRQ